MHSFASRIAHLDTPVVPETTPSTPTIWWFHGHKPARTPGVFYVKASALAQDPSEPWIASHRFEHEVGFETRALHLALITWRQQPYQVVETTTTAGGVPRKERRYITEWQPGAQIHTEILCFAEGIAEPVIWSFHGLTGRAVMGKTGIFNTYRNGLLREAEQLTGKRLPLWTFWLPITTQVNGKGQVSYTDTGHGAFVTLPMLALDPIPAAAAPSTAPPAAPPPASARMDTLFVGEEWLAHGYTVHAQFEHWRLQRRGRTDPLASAHPSDTAERHAGTS